MDKKITLIITGQLRLHENQNLSEKIKNHIDFINPDETILFLWEQEYLYHKEEIDRLNLKLIICNPHFCVIHQKIIDKMFKSQNKLQLINEIDQDDNQFYNNVLKYLYQIQYIFQNIEYTSDIYITTRYDNIYYGKFQIEKLLDFYNEDKPIIATPFGGDLNQIGLGHLLTITNNKGSNIFKNIYNNYLQNILDEKIPMYTELAFRYIFKNLNDSTVYRFHLLMTTEKYLKRQLFYHVDKNIFQKHGFNNIGEIIGIDNLFLPDY